MILTTATFAVSEGQTLCAFATSMIYHAKCRCNCECNRQT